MSLEDILQGFTKETQQKAPKYKIERKFDAIVRYLDRHTEKQVLKANEGEAQK